MKKEIITFEYEGIEIQFGIGEAVWMNATEIAKHHGKLIGNWTRNSSTDEYIAALKTRYAKTHNGKNQEFVMISQGGSLQGTWIHQKLAIRFAQWLSADFAVWVDEQIETLLTTGKVEIEPRPETTAISLPDFSNPGAAARAWADQYEARMIAEASAKENQEKAEIVNLIVEKADNYTMQQAANVLGTGRTRFFKWLRENGYFQENNEPYQKYIGQHAYFTVKEIPKDGKIYHTPFVTPLGLTHFAKKIEKLENIRNKSSKTLVLFNPN